MDIFKDNSNTALLLNSGHFEYATNLLELTNEPNLNQLVASTNLFGENLSFFCKSNNNSFVDVVEDEFKQSPSFGLSNHVSLDDILQEVATFSDVHDIVEKPEFLENDSTNLLHSNGALVLNGSKSPSDTLDISMARFGKCFCYNLVISVVKLLDDMIVDI